MTKYLLKARHAVNLPLHHLSLENMTLKQKQKIKSFIVDSNNQLNAIFPAFDPLNDELSPGHRLINIFSDCILFHKVQYKNNTNITNTNITFHLCNLNAITLKASSNIKSAIIVTNASVKSNNITTSVTHIYSCNNSSRKTIYYTINIMSIEAKLFVLKYGINQALQIPKVSCIIVIKNSIYTAQKIFDPLNLPYQI